MELLRKSLIALSVVSLLSLGALYGDETKDVKENSCLAYQAGTKDEVKKDSNASDFNKGVENKDVAPKVDATGTDATKQVVPVPEQIPVKPVK